MNIQRRTAHGRPGRRLANRPHWLQRGRVLWLIARPARNEGLVWVDSWGKNHGTLSGGVAFKGSTRPRWPAHANFSTSTSAVTVAADAKLQLTGDWTYAVWCRTSGTPGANNVYSLFSHWTNSSSGRQIFLYLDGNHASKVQVDIPFIKAVLTGTTSVNDGNWHRVVVTKLGTVWTIYLDGVQDAQATDATAQEACTGVLELGYSTPSTSATKSFGGDLDDFVVLNRAWTAYEARQDNLLARAGYPGIVARPLLLSSPSGSTLSKSAAGSIVFTAAAAANRILVSSGSAAILMHAAAVAAGIHPRAAAASLILSATAAAARVASPIAAASLVISAVAAETVAHGGLNLAGQATVFLSAAAAEILAHSGAGSATLVLTSSGDATGGSRVVEVATGVHLRLAARAKLRRVLPVPEVEYLGRYQAGGLLSPRFGDKALPPESYRVMDLPGRHLVVSYAKDPSGRIVVEAGLYEVVPGGDPASEVLAAHALEGPGRPQVMAQLASGLLVAGADPQVDDGA